MAHYGYTYDFAIVLAEISALLSSQCLFLEVGAREQHRTSGRDTTPDWKTFREWLKQLERFVVLM